MTFSIWNTSTNVGGGLAGVVAAWAASSFGGWHYAFHFPGALAAVGSFYLFWRLCDTPQSVGLPPIEEYRSGHAAAACSSPQAERELTTRELLLEYVLTNRYIWVLAIANFFAYITRYSMLDWGPMYLREVKGATIPGGSSAIFFTEFRGIPSTILLGWLSDRLGGRRGMVAVLALTPILAAFAAILLIPPGYLWLDLAMLSLIGLFIYPVLTLIMIMSLDLTSKKAVGTAAGFVGLFGYLGRTCENMWFGWMLKHGHAQAEAGAAWNQVIWAILACTAVAVVLMTLT